MSQNLSEQCMRWDGEVTLTTATSCVLIVGYVCASLVSIFLIRCAVNLFKQTEDAMHLFLAFMTAADLLLTAFAFPAELVRRMISLPKSIVFCGIVRSSSYLGLATSGLFLALVNASAILTSSLIIVACLWTFKVVYFKPPCEFFISHGKGYVYDIFVVVTSMVPFVSSLVFSVVLLCLYRRRNASDLPAMAFGNRIESLAFIFATTLWTAISLLPFRIFSVWYLHAYAAGQCQPMWVRWTAWTLDSFLLSSPIGNCLITSLVYAPYRSEMARIVAKLRTSAPREPESFEMS